MTRSVLKIGLAMLLVAAFIAAPVAGGCRDCVLDTHCVNLADGFGFRYCTQRVSCRQICIRYEGDSCREWEEFGCVDIGCRATQACSGFPY